jgi:tetratricopeptide (TPR) repeat protein
MNAPTSRLLTIIYLPIVLLSIATVSVVAQGPGSQDPLLRQGQQKDLAGQYVDARKDFATALETASTPRAKGAAIRSMAMSYAFEANCKEATKYESQLYEMYLADQDFFNAGEIADELARVCIDAGDLDAASAWYRMGHDAGLREPNITPARTDLWNFRWEHAQARIAARRGDKAGAQAHVAAAQAILDKETNPDQAQFFPYLTGYVALYSGNYAEALADLQKANQNDPFIQCLIAQTYEHLGDQAKANEFYRKALTASNAHNPPNAYARPLAKRKLGIP